MLNIIGADERATLVEAKTFDILRAHKLGPIG